MKQARLGEDFVAAHQLRANLADWLRHVRQSGRPVVITQRGRPAAVLVQPEALDELQEEREVLGKVLRGLRDLEEGRLVDDHDVWAEVDRVVAGSEATGEDPVD